MTLTLDQTQVNAAKGRCDEVGNYRLNAFNACAFPRTHTPRRTQFAEWPTEADFILSALDSARAGGRPERRQVGRVVLRELASLKLFSDQPGDEPWVLCTRDATTRSLGFITRCRLPLGYGGVLHVRGPNGEELSINCTVRRCHETVNGWYEGSLSFNREQFAFDHANTRDAD